MQEKYEEIMADKEAPDLYLKVQYYLIHRKMNYKRWRINLRDWNK